MEWFDSLGSRMVTFAIFEAGWICLRPKRVVGSERSVVGELRCVIYVRRQGWDAS